MNAKVAGAHIAEAFSQLDPKSADFYRANSKRFSDRLDAKLAEWQKLLAPFKGTKFISYHEEWHISRTVSAWWLSARLN